MKTIYERFCFVFFLRMFAHWTITGMFYVTALRFDLNIEGILTFFFIL